MERTGPAFQFSGSPGELTGANRIRFAFASGDESHDTERTGRPGKLVAAPRCVMPEFAVSVPFVRLAAS